MFLTEKQDKSAKGRMVHNGKPTREWLSREESASPTAATESATLTSCVDAHEQRDVVTADVPNAFAQARMPVSNGNEENGYSIDTIKICSIRANLCNFYIYP